MRVFRRNFIAKDLLSKKFRSRVVRSKKGKGSFRRKPKSFKKI